MQYQGFCGPSNPSQSLIADAEVTKNWYVEAVESKAAPTGAALYPCPGQRTWATVTDVGWRGSIVANDRAFVVIGTGFYEIFATKLTTLRGRVTQDNNPATLSYNGLSGGQVLITSGTHAYCYVLATNTLTQVLTGEATQCGMMNARFLAFNIANGKVRLSALNDGTTWDPTLYFQRTLGSDPWQAMVVAPPEIWMIGTQTSEIWVNTSAFPQPFAPFGGAFFKWGTTATFSAGLAGDSVTWLGQTDGGAGTMVATTGSTPQPISNFAVENALKGYASLTDCELLVYRDGGHLFAGFSFPTGRGTWVYDFTLNAWHERESWVSAQNRYDAWHPRGHLYAFNTHLVGDRATGTISELSTAIGSDNGAPIRRIRIAPPLWASSRERLVVSRLGVRVEPGLGISSGQGSLPMMLLRTSEDAKTWSPERRTSAGAMGQYGAQIFWNRCGSSKDIWMPEISVTDPIPWRISGAEIDGTGFSRAGA